jgi:hypothetical protein
MALSSGETSWYSRHGSVPQRWAKTGRGSATLLLRTVLNDVVAVIRPQVDAKAKCVRVAHRLVRPAPVSPHRGRADFRGGDGYQFGRRGRRPEQAECDQGGEADQSDATHFHPSSWQDGARIFFAIRM